MASPSTRGSSPLRRSAASTGPVTGRTKTHATAAGSHPRAPPSDPGGDWSASSLSTEGAGRSESSGVASRSTVLLDAASALAPRPSSAGRGLRSDCADGSARTFNGGSLYLGRKHGRHVATVVTVATLPTSAVPSRTRRRARIAASSMESSSSRSLTVTSLRKGTAAGEGAGFEGAPSVQMLPRRAPHRPIARGDTRRASG